MAHRLESVSITDFRSIGGTVTVPLDAQMVLLYGPNGTGKTSVLSAIELALTGSVDAMRRVDGNFLQHLVHRGSSHAEISVTGRLPGYTDSQSWSLSSQDKGWPAAGILQGPDASYYSERCYLAQATLGRLLEIYESNERSHESALTRFVNDVLRLDSLQSLIEGLHEARDIRNTRHLVPEFAALERELKANSSDEERVRVALASLQAELDAIASEAVASLEQLNITSDEPLQQAFDLALHETESLSDERTLTELTRHRREIDDMRRQLTSAGQASKENDFGVLEVRAADSASALDVWARSSGSAIDAVLDEIRSDFPSLPSAAETSPADALNRALESVKGELERARSARKVDDERLSAESELDGRIQQQHSRLAVIDERTSTDLAGAAEIARVLTEAVPHTHDSTCILCGRDYAEVSDEPLSAHIARRAAQLTEQADRLSALAQARMEATEELNRATNSLTLLRAQILSSAAKSELISRAAKMESWMTRLQDLATEADRGTVLARTSNEARRLLLTARRDAEALASIRESASRTSDALRLPHVGDFEPVSDLLGRLSTHVHSAISETERRISARKLLEQLQRRWRQVSTDLENSRKEQRSIVQHATELVGARDLFEENRGIARQVVRTSTEVRQSIISTVFNDSLNKVWRDLFVRLAPHEPFVPIFDVSEDVADQSPRLKTAYRGGGNGGSPGAMLSAGNLNTAALTLFLALHLSTSDRLPFLVLDDPVQSMDDVHISQFAALLRTLSKQHGKQIIVAVHERALFDYLSLELSPAFPDDRLITVELKKHASGTTAAEPTYHHWHEDPVRASA